MRFYLDEDLSWKIAAIARGLGVDVISTRDAGRNGATDEEQLRFAAAELRCIVTGNARDFEPETRRFLANGWPHAGVICVSPSLARRAPSIIARALRRYDLDYPHGTPAYLVDYLAPSPG